MSSSNLSTASSQASSSSSSLTSDVDEVLSKKRKLSQAKNQRYRENLIKGIDEATTFNPNLLDNDFVVDYHDNAFLENSDSTNSSTSADSSLLINESCNFNF